MNLTEYYDAMRQAALPKLAQGAAELDKLIDSAQDRRRGITLLARPPARITAIIEGIIADLKRAEPDQYYYPAADIHLTILSIISCYNGFTLDLVDPAAYKTAVRAILQPIRPFIITYNGLTATTGGIIIQGFPQDEELTQLRNATRGFFQHAGLQHSIDQRYNIHTAHSTVMRFKTLLQNPQLLLEKIEHYQHYFIGSFEVDTVELVYNDWYQRTSNTVLLGKFSLGAAATPTNRLPAFS